MSFLSILLTLLIEQARPLTPRNAIHRWYLRYVNSLGNHFNAGQQDQGMVAWLLAVLPWVAVSMAIHYFLLDISILAAWIWNVAVLYVTMGFRQFSHVFTEIVEALRVGDIDKARALLTEFRGESAAEYNGTEISKVAIEEGLINSHRHVFGVIFWFMILPGPSGAVLYRLAGSLEQRWGTRSIEDYGDFGKFTQKIFHYLDWIPVRLTAMSFAIAGDFEDAVYCWRSQATTWTDPEQGVVLASGAGALGVRLGETLHHHGTVSFRPELGLGDDADVNTMASAIGLLWRALVIWMFILALMTVARWFGG
ncbi:MAG TPA: CobD/CbiB family protein [Burkholderiales bacterium]|nr:CobD/CbiB family protein [Burkholderiales bacterium]